MLSMNGLEQLEARVQGLAELPQPADRRALRKAAGATLSDIASAVGTTAEAVRLWESGSRTPRGANLEAYLRALRICKRAASNAT